MLRLITAINILIVMFSVSSCKAATNQAYALGGENDIYVIDVASMQVEKKHIVDVMNLTMVEISPSGRYLSWRALWLEPDTCLCELIGKNPDILVIINLESGKADTICNVMAYDWSPSEDKLVYILLHMVEDAMNSGTGYAIYSGGDVYLYDLDSGLKREIFIGSYTMKGVSWSEYDKNIYTLDSYGVQKYDLVADSIKDATLLDFLISPDGKYSYLQTSEGDPTVLSRTKDYSLEELFSYPSGVYDEDSFCEGLISWGVIDGESVAYVEKDGLQYIVCSTGQVRKVIPPPRT